MAETAMSNVMLESAGYDVGAYFALVQRIDIHDSILGFHAQQGIEKALKAALFKHSVFVPKTHSLGYLLQALSDANVEAPPHADLIDTLDPYAVQARYGALGIGALDRLIVGTWLKDVVDWAAGL